MTTSPDLLNDKILRTLPDRVILKPLTRWNEAYKELPHLVLNTLWHAMWTPKTLCQGNKEVDRILNEHYTSPQKKELIKSAIKEKGDYTLLEPLTVRLEAGKDHYWAEVPAIGENTVRVSQKVLQQYGEILLTSGAWGTMVIEY